MWFNCPYLKSEIDLSDERFAHIASRHPELLPQHLDLIAQTLSDPDEIRVDPDYRDTCLIIRWYNEVLGGKNVVVVVITDTTPPRSWIVTALVMRGKAKGTLQWKKT